MSWSIPITRIAGITVRIHLLFVLYILGEVLFYLKNAPQYALEMFLLLMMLFFIVLLHELGHCFAARSVGGSAEKILLWPLGGLAYVDHPHHPWASFITTAGGPAVNLLLFFVAGIVLLIMGFWPPFNPAWSVFTGDMRIIGGEGISVERLPWYSNWLARFFYLNWFLFWFNVLCVGFPLDGGRLLQSALWPRFGYYLATKIACYAGFVVGFVIILSAYIFSGDKSYTAPMLGFGLALFIFITCYVELQNLERGVPEDDSLGYDFSQGYTSLERSANAKNRRSSFLQRWWEERNERKRQREEEQRLADEQRVDELLAKMHEGGGIQALTPEEQRFMKRVSAKLRQRKKS